MTQIKSQVIQQDSYYPFGLRFDSYSRENALPNRTKLFQGQEHIDDLGLNWDSFKWRNHQPDIGRFFSVDKLAEKYLYNSPYAFSENQVVAHVELEGLEKVKAVVRPVDRVFQSFTSIPYARETSFSVTYDVGKNKIEGTDCKGECGSHSGPKLRPNKDGSSTVSGVADFGDGKYGHAAYSFTFTNNAKEGTFNVRSSIVTDNKAPFEVTMTGTNNDWGFLLNVVAQTPNSTMTFTNDAPEQAENQSDMDVKVDHKENPTTLGNVKNANEDAFKSQAENDKEKAKTPVINRKSQ